MNPLQAHATRKGRERGIALVNPRAQASRGAPSTLRPWERRVHALKTRLQQTLGRSLGVATPSGEGRDAALVTWRKRCSTLEAALQQAHSDLARLQSELVGTRAGEQKAHHLALHDGLTGLPNRRFFLNRLNQVLSNKPPQIATPCVLYLDLDGFKGVNDAHGHQTGDDLLRVVARRLAQGVRAGDMVARLGGDEFACLLEKPLPREQLLMLAHKLYQTIAAPMTLGDLSLSIGVARCPDDACTAENLLARADAAMYHAKHQRSKVECASLPGG